MKNLASLIQSILSLKWVENNPSYSSGSVSCTTVKFVFDEYDPKAPTMQILLENLPDKKTWLVPQLVRVDHKVKITIFIKPIHYAETDLETYKDTFTNMKSEIDRILTYNKFSIDPSINNLVLGGWDDKQTVAAGRGTKVRREPIQFRSIQIVTATYYITTSRVINRSITEKIGLKEPNIIHTKLNDSENFGRMDFGSTHMDIQGLAIGMVLTTPSDMYSLIEIWIALCSTTYGSTTGSCAVYETDGTYVGESALSVNFGLSTSLDYHFIPFSFANLVLSPNTQYIFMVHIWTGIAAWLPYDTTQSHTQWYKSLPNNSNWPDPLDGTQGSDWYPSIYMTYIP